jgi:alkaline phosphatase D
MPFTRRGLLGAASAFLAAPAHRAAARRPQLGVPFLDYPFSLGVAAGEPGPAGFTIWTRIAPRPLVPGYGMAPRPVSVRYEVSESRDSAGSRLRAKSSLGRRSRIRRASRSLACGRTACTITALCPAASARPWAGPALCRWPARPSPAMRLGVVGCQHYEDGLYTAFRHLAREDCHAVFHYGDYIYEYGRRAGTIDRVTQEPVPTVRQHLGQECFTLDDYRLRYAQTKADFDLQFAHATAAWLPSYDDHEIANNWVGEAGTDDTPPELFHLRRQAAMQAWYEHMPVPETFLPRDGRIAAWRGFRWGNLLDARVLNTRAYRSDQPCGDRFASTCEGVRDPRAEVLGSAGGLARGRAEPLRRALEGAAAAGDDDGPAARVARLARRQHG